MGHQTEEIPVPDVLRFVMGTYLIDYQVKANEILIFAIRRGRERPPGLEMEDDEDYEI